MSEFLWILDNGHGGIINGVYQTPGKRSPVWPDGRQVFEGDLNRKIVLYLSHALDKMGISYKVLVPELEDIPLKTRGARIGKISAQSKKKCILLSIHCNAGGGTGWECFTTRGKTEADPIATQLYQSASEIIPKFRLRTDTLDGDPDKEADWTVIYMAEKAGVPGVLTENLFMDTLNPDCEFLMTESGLEHLAAIHFDTIRKIENKFERI